MSFPFYKQPATYIGRELDARRDNLVSSRMSAWVSVTSNLSTSNDNETPSGGKTIASLTYKNVFGTDASYTTTPSAPNIRPNPIVSGFSIDFSNRGTLRKATIKIKCFTLEQVQEIQKFFLEPGISVFVQWGWNHTSAGASVHPRPTTPSEQLKFYRRISELNSIRDYNKGCYDNLVGIITGGQTTIQDDGFEVTTKVSSLGELLRGMSTGDPVTSVTDENNRDTSIQPRYSDTDINKLREVNEVSSGGTGGASFTKIVGTPRLVQWAYLYNELPDTMKTREIMQWGEDNIRLGDLIGFDDAVRDSVKDGINQSLWNVDKFTFLNKTFSATENDTPVSDQRYIKFSTFIGLLNEFSRVRKGSTSGWSRFKIDIDYSFCGSFRSIFSCHENVFIPNTQAWNWYNRNPNYTNSITANSNISGSGGPERIDNSIIAENGDKISFPDLYNFAKKSNVPILINGDSVSIRDLSIDEADTTQSRWFTFPRGSVGWIGDLYINSRLAFNVFTNTTMPIDDLLTETLNEMAKATDGFWHFQLVEDSKDHVLKIIDENLTNEIDAKAAKKLEIILYGPNSHVLSSNFSIDIPRVMANKIVMQKSATDDVLISKDAGIRGLFSNKKDSVLWNYSPEKESNLLTQNKSVKATEKDDVSIRIERWKAFVKTAKLLVQPKLTALGTVYREMKTPTGTVADKILIPGVSIYPDTFTSALRGELSKTTKTGASNGVSTISSSTPLPVKVEFTVLGISGFKVGDLINLKGVPLNFSDQMIGTFVVTEIKHTVDQKMWTTDVTATYKPYSKP